MNNKPIGIFDSGIGGLTVVRNILDLLPNENIIYFGDTANVPYGSKSEEEIIHLVRKDAEFLSSFDLKALVIACNTADAIARKIIEKEYSLPIIGVITPTCLKAVEKTKNKKIGVLATDATVHSDIYAETLHQFNKDVKVFQIACPKLVPLIEKGEFTKDCSETKDVLNEYLMPLKKEDIDTLILGCTHYPLLKERILEIMPNVNLISSSESAGKELKDRLTSLDLLNNETNPKHEYYVSKDPSGIKEKARYILPLNEIRLKP